MDFSFIRQNEEDVFKGDLFNSKDSKSTPEITGENWSSSTGDILDSIFPMDFLNNLTDHQSEFGILGEYNEYMKLEPEDYEISEPTLPEPLFSNNIISSNSSDSGLSSDNLESEMNRSYEPLISSSSGSIISEKGVKRSSVEVSSINLTHPTQKTILNNEHKRKVIVQKVPQVLNIKHATAIQKQKKHYHKINTQSTQQELSTVNRVLKNEIKIVKLSPQLFAASNNKSVTIQVKNSNSGAKIQAKPGTLFLNKANITEMNKFVRVQNNNPRSVLIPVSLHDVKELKKIQIVSTEVRSTPLKMHEPCETNCQYKVKQIAKPNTFEAVDIEEESPKNSFNEHSSDSESIIIEDDDDVDYLLDPDVPYPKLALTLEERRLLGKEGIKLPTHYPLTKHEERELKRIRRKIRNKISAQDSRKRKKEYVDGLEERVKLCTEENQSLMKRIKQLQHQNQNLTLQMKKLQSLIKKGTNKTTQPTTCLMILLLSLALVAAPNLKLGDNPREADLEEVVQQTILQNRRSLLFNIKDHSTDVFDEDVNTSDIATAFDFTNERENNVVCKFTQNSLEEQACKKKKITRSDFLDEIDDENWYLSKKNQEKSLANSAVEFLNDMRQHLHTSGFNLENSKQVESFKEDKKHSWLHKDIVENVSPTPNFLYETDMYKTAAGNYVGSPQTTIFNVPANQMYENKIQNKLNSSEMRQINKY